MPFYTIDFDQSRLKVFIQEDEVQVKRLKNHVLGHLEGVNYSGLIIYMIEGNNRFILDDNEIIDNEQILTLEID